MMSLIPRFEKAASGAGTITFAGAEPQTITWARLHEDARSMAAAMQARGIKPGDHVALLGPTTRNLVTAIQATILCGAAVVVLPLPLRLGSLDEFVRQTRSRVRAADAAMLAIDPDFDGVVAPEAGDPPIVRFDELLPMVDPLPPTAYERPLEDPDALGVLQFTSGSTSEPKGVMLPHRQLCANLDGIAAAGRLDVVDDVFVSWLPVYHDMGLVGFLLLPMTTGARLVLGAPQDFLARPIRWLEWISEHGGSVTAAPNFAYGLATRALRKAEGLDLSRVRVCLNGAEPIEPETFRSFLAEAARFGFRPEAAYPAFGMAEVCIGGTFPEPMTGFRTDVVDSRLLETEHYASPVDPGAPRARELARLGRPVPGLELAIVDTDTGRRLSEREVGEVQIRGTSVTTGYYRRPDATAESFAGEWLRTGDLGYLVDGELVLCGRLKDLIIIGGRNIYPQDVEWAVGSVPGVRAGNVVAFGSEGRHGKQHIVVVAEVREEADAVEVRRAVVEQVVAEIGVPPREVALVAPGMVPKTSSGKLQRALCRRQYEDRVLELR